MKVSVKYQTITLLPTVIPDITSYSMVVYKNNLFAHLNTINSTKLETNAKK